MNSDLLTELSFRFTIIASVVSVASVTLCSVISAIITQRGMKDTKKTELFFREMASAYYEYLCASTGWDEYNNVDQLTRLANASARAMLFASERTQDLINSRKKIQSRTNLAKEKGKLEEMFSLAEEGYALQKQLLSSMQDDLYKGYHPHRQHKRKKGYGND